MKIHSFIPAVRRRFFPAILLSAIIALLGASSAVAHETYVFIPGRGLPPEAARAALADSMRFMLEKAASGARVLVCDPVSRSVRASFVVPPGTLRQRANDRGMREGIAELKKAFLDTPARAPWERTAICLPQTLEFLRAQVIHSGQSAVVVAFGDPLNRAPEDSDAFVWRDGVVPTTGWILGDADSPFSAKRLGDLKGVRVHVAAVPTEWGADDWQRKGVQEFLSAMCDEAGGKLVSLADVKLVLARVADGIGDALVFPAIDRTDTARAYRRKIFIRGQEQEIVVKSATDQTAIAPDTVITATAVPAGEVSSSKAPPVEAGLNNNASIVSETTSTTVQGTYEAQVPVLPEHKNMPPTLANVSVEPATAESKPSPAIAEAATRLVPIMPAQTLGIAVLWEPIDGNPGTKCDLDISASVRGVDGVCDWRTMRLPRNDSNPVLVLHNDLRSAGGLHPAVDDNRSMEFLEIRRPVALEAVTCKVTVYDAPRGSPPLRVLFRLQTADGLTHSEIFDLPAKRGEAKVIDLVKLAGAENVASVSTAPPKP